MPWKLTNDEKAKFEKEIDENYSKLLEDKNFLEHFNISEEEAKKQLASRPKKD